MHHTTSEAELRTIGYAHQSPVYVPASSIIVPDVTHELLSYYRNRPEALRNDSPRAFEKLIAAILKNHGYSVELTPPVRDGGYDLIAVEHSRFTGSQVYLVECKRYSAARKVGIGVVRGLYGIVSSQDATKGIIVTTSSFTRGAEELAATVLTTAQPTGRTGTPTKKETSCWLIRMCWEGERIIRWPGRLRARRPARDLFE